MIPIRDTIQSKKTPVVTWLIIAANALVFFYELQLSSSGLSRFISNYGLVPAKLSLFNPLSWSALISHMFLHGSWLHFLSNMWIFFIFGDNVEDRLGTFRYLLFYIVGGITAGLIQTVFGDPNTPTIGASGAIAAVLGAYFLFYPTARVITIIPIFIFPWFVRIPAILYLGFWFLSQLWSGFLSLNGISGTGASNVAWWAHIGGFIFGLLFAIPFIKRKRRQQIYPDEYLPF